MRTESTLYEGEVVEGVKEGKGHEVLKNGD